MQLFEIMGAGKFTKMASITSSDDGDMNPTGSASVFSGGKPDKRKNRPKRKAANDANDINQQLMQAQGEGPGTPRTPAKKKKDKPGARLLKGPDWWKVGRKRMETPPAWLSSSIILPGAERANRDADRMWQARWGRRVTVLNKAPPPTPPPNDGDHKSAKEGYCIVHDTDTAPGAEPDDPHSYKIADLLDKNQEWCQQEVEKRLAQCEEIQLEAGAASSAMQRRAAQQLRLLLWYEIANGHLVPIDKTHDRVKRYHKEQDKRAAHMRAIHRQLEEKNVWNEGRKGPTVSSRAHVHTQNCVNAHNYVSVDKFGRVTTRHTPDVHGTTAFAATCPCQKKTGDGAPQGSPGNAGGGHEKYEFIKINLDYKDQQSQDAFEAAFIPPNL